MFERASRHVFERASIFVLVNVGARRVCRVARSPNVQRALARKMGNARCMEKDDSASKHAQGMCYPKTVQHLYA